MATKSSPVACEKAEAQFADEKFPPPQTGKKRFKTFRAKKKVRK
jgi:hypothetical protein